MSALYRTQIAQAIAAARIRSATSFSWFGRVSLPLPRAVRLSLDAAAAARCLVEGLRHQLYADFYVLGLATRAAAAPAGSCAAEVQEHSARLSRANCGRGYWEPGWIIERVDADAAHVKKGALRLRAGDVEFEVTREGRVEGAECRVRLSSEEVGTSPGYYSATGETPLSEGEGGIFRLYWNITAAAAVPLMRSITRRLNENGVPFRCKVLKDPAAYIRCDAAVLYLRESHLARAVACVRDIARRLAPELKPGTPALTKPLATGIGLAQDPGSGESFGLHRCGLLAEALVRAHAAGAHSVDARLALVESRFAECGLSLDRPYLNAGTSDPEIDLSVARRSPSRPSAGNDRPMDRGELIAAARAIGDRLCAQALWHERRCSWVGVVSDPAADGEPAVNVCRALGPEIYSGASGVALFLAQLHASSAPSRRLRDTARGAIRQAIARCEGVRPDLRLGLYSGWPGIALAATRVGQLLGDDECLGGAVTLAARLREIVNVRRRSEFDLLSGSAGAIVALLFLRRALPCKGLGGLAVALGDRLLRSASNEGTRSMSSSWAAVNFPARRNLTGYSHGTAGVASALLELAQATGDARYRAGAERAFAYERRWFNPREQNWPDFRESEGRRNEPDYASAWCHGAPGIALSRLRAWELVADAGCRAEGLIAVETTRTVLRDALDAGATGYTLCHGLAGNADVLLEMQRLERRDADARLIHEVAARLRPHTDRPSLMVGQAGVGYFYLRIAAASVPSILLIRAVPA